MRGVRARTVEVTVSTTDMTLTSILRMCAWMDERMTSTEPAPLASFVARSCYAVLLPRQGSKGVTKGRGKKNKPEGKKKKKPAEKRPKT